MLRSTVKKLNLGFSIGDEVAVDGDQIYGSYTQFVKLHRKYAPRFQYKKWELDSNATELKVLGVYRHVRKDTYDKNKYVVVVVDKFKRIYLVGETGVKPYEKTLCEAEQNGNADAIKSYQMKRAKEYITDHRSADGSEDTLEVCIISDLLRIMNGA